MFTPYFPKDSVQCFDGIKPVFDEPKKKFIKATTCLSEEDNQWLSDFVNVVSMVSGDLRYGRSTAICEAVRFFRSHFLAA